MWSKLVKLSQDVAFKRLMVAVIISAVLHAFLARQFNLTLPFFKKQTQVIEARLVVPTLNKKVETAAPKSEQSLKKIAESAPLKNPKPPKPVAPVVETLPLPEPDLPATEPVNVAPVPDVLAEDFPNQPQETQPEAQPEQHEPVADNALVINENAYPFVETFFDVRTKIDGPVEGESTITYQRTNESQYQLSWLTEAHGLAALVVSDLLQTSEGTVTQTGLQPNHYLYQYGNNNEKRYTATFDWAQKKVSLNTPKGSKTQDIADGTQDLLSFMYQFMYVAPLQRMQINIATGKKLAMYDYSFEGEEDIVTGLGNIKAVHIVHTGNESDEKTELWLAVDYQYVPVKIRKTEKNGRLYELVMRKVNTQQQIMLP
jgi:hypothetical protein